METGIKVIDAMTKQPVYISPDVTLGECSSLMAEEHVGALVVKGKDILGLISEQDIVRKVIAKGFNPLEKKVKDYTETALVTIEPDADIFEALLKMKEENIRHLPVLENGKLVGLLTLKDILKIEPQLFDLLVEKFNIREAERKPISKIVRSEKICQVCGDFSEKIETVNDMAVCPNCK
ncbi:cyclic nucleotide-binding/CBS domain-containing protein [Nanoarchaeota archaeon]